jgi:hypothetical protein
MQKSPGREFGVFFCLFSVKKTISTAELTINPASKEGTLVDPARIDLNSGGSKFDPLESIFYRHDPPYRNNGKRGDASNFPEALTGGGG